MPRPSISQRVTRTSSHRSQQARPCVQRAERTALIVPVFFNEVDLNTEVRYKRRGQTGRHRGTDGAILQRLDETPGSAEKRADGKVEAFAY